MSTLLKGGPQEVLTCLEGGGGGGGCNKLFFLLSRCIDYTLLYIYIYI